MTKTDKKIVEAAKMIKEYCESRSGCVGCVFDAGWSFCVLTGDTDCLNPKKWYLEVDDD